MNVPNRGEREPVLQRLSIDSGVAGRGGDRFSLRDWFHRHPIWGLPIGRTTLGTLANRLIPHVGTGHVRLKSRRS